MRLWGCATTGAVQEYGFHGYDAFVRVRSSLPSTSLCVSKAANLIEDAAHAVLEGENENATMHLYGCHKSSDR